MTRTLLLPAVAALAVAACARSANVDAAAAAGVSARAYPIGQPLDLRGLVVTADYTDGIENEALLPGYGGYSVSGDDPRIPGTQTVTVSYTVAGRTKTASFQVVVDGLRRPEGAPP